MDRIDHMTSQPVSFVRGCIVADANMVEATHRSRWPIAGPG